jgi:outer membrane protein
MTVGIAVTIPLFDGFLNRYRAREAEATVEVKEATLIDTESVTLTDVVKAHSDATATAANLQQSLSLLEAAQKSRASSKRRYDAGAANIIELLSTQRELAGARQERVRSLAEWRSAKLRLLATAGLLESSGL